MATTASTKSKKKLGSSSSFAAELLPQRKGSVSVENGGGSSEESVSVDNKEATMSKRQKLKLVNNKHKWPQQPRVSSPEARAKAYLRVSGLVHTPKEQIDAKLDLNSPSVRFGRLLGSPDQRVRHQAVLKLRIYLKARCDVTANAGLSEMDLLKLWKGLWHTVYMADKVPVQEELSDHLANLIWCVAGTEEEDEYAGQAYMRLFGDEESDDEDSGYKGEKEEDLALNGAEESIGDKGNDEEIEKGEDESGSDVLGDDDTDDNDQFEGDEESDSRSNSEEIPHCRGAHLASLFVRTFLRTVRREWGRMDKYRVDKFYSLVRKIIHQVFRYMALRHWNLGIIRLFNDALYDEILSQTPNGLRYHLIDITMEELALVHSEAPRSLTEATFIDCLEPYFAMAQTGGGDDTVQSRVLDKILSRFLIQYSLVGEVAEGSDNDAKLLLFDNVHVGTIANFIFEVASDPETRDRYRKSLYDIHKQYVRRLKLVGRDVDLEAFRNEDNCQDMGDEEIQRLENNEEGSEVETLYAEEEVRYDGDVDTPEHTSRKRKLDVDQVEASGGDNCGGEEAKRKKKKKKKKKRTASEDSTDSLKDKTKTEAPPLDQEAQKLDQTSNNIKENNKKSKAPPPDQEAQGTGEEIDQASNNIKENTKKSKKNRRKKRSNEDAAAPEDTTTENKEKKKRAKSEATRDGLSRDDDSGMPIKTKEKKSRTIKDDSLRQQEQEHEIVISSKEQKKARARSRRARETENKTSAETSETETKRVKFGSVNLARSWKASMKALRSANPSTPPATPETSILLNKGRASKVKKGSAKGRKKATDYFW